MRFLLTILPGLFLLAGCSPPEPRAIWPSDTISNAGLRAGGAGMGGPPPAKKTQPSKETAPVDADKTTKSPEKTEPVKTAPAKEPVSESKSPVAPKKEEAAPKQPAPDKTEAAKTPPATEKTPPETGTPKVPGKQ